MSKHRRRTKIICTVGPSSNDWKTILAMRDAGMDVVRINMSHSTHDDATKTVDLVQRLNATSRHPIPILLDTMGPEIRTGEIERPMLLKTGSNVFLGTRYPDCIPTDVLNVEVGFADFDKSIAVGDTVQLDNGLINLCVAKKIEGGLLCNVTHGGELGSRKHVNLPGVHVDLPSITAKDREDIQFAKEHEVSFIAQSFVRSADDVYTMRELLGDSYDWMRIIAKIENHEGVQEAEAIAKAAFGIMVARGDLGIETDIAGLPRLQRSLVDTALRSGRRCILATHLLESMVENPIPTRAEAIDVANAVYEGVDAVLLSSETSVGEHPELVIRYLDRILSESEGYPGLNFAEALVLDDIKQNLARSAVRLAERSGAAGIIVITRTGLMADLLTNCSPVDVPIFAFSHVAYTRRRLMLNRGVYTYGIELDPDAETTIGDAMGVLLELNDINGSDLVVVVSDVLGPGAVHSIQVRTADLDN